MRVLGASSRNILVGTGGEEEREVDFTLRSEKVPWEQSDVTEGRHATRNCDQSLLPFKWALDKERIY